MCSRGTDTPLQYRRLAGLVILSVLSVIMCGCAQDSVRVRDGKKYGVIGGTWRARWWNYYERGLSYQEGAFWLEAIADYQKAIQARPQDEWRARTYGLHFVSYFPNRELGICYFHTGDYPKAIEYLQRSLLQADTARAHKYVDSVRQAEFQAGTLSDSSQPELAVFPADSASTGILTEQSAIPSAYRAHRHRSPQIFGWPAVHLPWALPLLARELIFTAPQLDVAQTNPPKRSIFITALQNFPLLVRSKDNLTVASVSVQDKPIYMRNSEKEVEKVATVPLKEGVNEIEVSAEDLAGNSVKTGIQVRLDLNAPTIAVDSPPPALVTSETAVDIRGFVKDEGGLAKVALDEETLVSPTDLKEETAPLREFELSREGRALNRDVLNLIPIAAEDLAGNVNRYDVDVYQGTARPSEPQSWIQQDSMDEPVLALASSGTRGKEPAPIEFRSDFSDNADVFLPEIDLRGRVLAPLGIVSLQIDNVPLDVETAPIVNWTRKVALRPGPNAVVIRAIDAAGHVASETLHLTRLPGFLETPASRLKAVLLLEGYRKDALHELYAVFHEILSEDARFDLIAAETALAELPESSAVTAREAVTVAQRLNADVLLYGQFARMGNDLELVVHVTDPATRNLLRTVDGQAPAEDIDAVKFELQGITQQIRSALPRLQARVTEMGTLDRGTEAGWRDGTLVLVGTPATATADFRLLGRARIVRAAKESCTFELLERINEEIAGVQLVAVAR